VSDVTTAALTADFLAQTGFSVLKSYWPQSSVEKLQWEWSQKTLQKFKVSLQVEGTIHPQRPMIFLGNHISYFDIVLLMATVPAVSFVAKKELSHWPLFGHAARKTNTIFVKREKNKSRKEARAAIHKALDQKQRVAVFPSGTTCLDEAKPWRRGIFEIAKEANVQIQPFRLTYKPLREVAYIGNDFFPTHLFKLLRLNEIKAKIEFHSPVTITDPELESEKWRVWAQSPQFHKSNHE
jgi:1-acyl-sn-glycerol-3-phosphate acyltransferase